MAGILIIAHTPFASALRDCIAHIYGGLPARIGVLDIAPTDDPDQNSAKPLYGCVQTRRPRPARRRG